MLVVRILRAIVDKAKAPDIGKVEAPFQKKRRETLRGLFKNLIGYLGWFFGVVLILDCFGIPVLAILSTVGIVGVALAFGAQSLCKDVITGLFIIVENQYFVGEYVEILNVAGIVEEFTLRCTYLRDFDGRLHIIPNGSTGLVTNHHRGNRRVMVEIGIAYERDIGEALTILQKVCDSVNEAYKDVVRDRITAVGVVDLSASGVIVRLVGKSETMMQWEIERALRRQSLDALKAAGYEIPYPHSHVVFEQYSGAGDR